MARKLIDIFFGLFSPPPQKKKKLNLGAYKCQKSKKSKFLKIAWNGKKIGRKWFLAFLAPPPKKKIKLGGVQKKFVENEKNQSYSTLPEMARKLVENNFGSFYPSPTKKIKKYGI